MIRQGDRIAMSFTLFIGGAAIFVSYFFKFRNAKDCKEPSADVDCMWHKANSYGGMAVSGLLVLLAFLYCCFYNRCVGIFGMMASFIGVGNQIAFMVVYMKSDFYKLAGEQFENSFLNRQIAPGGALLMMGFVFLSLILNQNWKEDKVLDSQTQRQMSSDGRRFKDRNF